MRNEKGQFVKGYTYKASEEHKKKVSQSKLGIKRPQWVKDKISQSRRDRFKGENAGNWKGGRVNQGQGYIWIYMPTHPFATQDGYILEHRLIVEQRIGRYLEKKEHIHHMNHVSWDNRSENLMIVSPAEHNRIIHKGKKREGLRGKHIG